ncbi:MAG: hypothetical protein P4M13_09275 [Alphaproteobacteria bacterium]|nr:hypothetical protein [Alphaproteobacteria bacterium]
MIEIGAVASENSNLTLGGSASADTVDHSYARYPNEAAGAGTATMSFDDFLDMINPLEHIPVVSSIYRAVTGENINPVSRIAGDTLYGGALGLASAGLSALGAIGDEVVAANNEGQSASATLVAALVGSDSSSDIKLAAASSSPATASTATQTASVQTPAPQSPIAQTPDSSSKPSAQTASVAASARPIALASTADAPIASGKFLPLDRSKPAYSGVMDSAMVQSAQQNQALALSLSGQSSLLQAQRKLRSNRFAVAAPTTANAAASATNIQADPETQAAVQNLARELQAMKSVNRYKSSAQMTPIPGGTVDMVN